MTQQLHADQTTDIYIHVVYFPQAWHRKTEHTRLLYYQRVKRQEICFGDSGVRLGVMGRVVMVAVPEATIRMGIAVDSKLE